MREPRDVKCQVSSKCDNDTPFDTSSNLYFSSLLIAKRNLNQLKLFFFLIASTDKTGGCTHFAHNSQVYPY
ncbi:hypothetical protein L2E82_38359 [Cichorium intybus]|uniref:Uncharacterized protein n=1 Tax=Cichorium intybus TaxID=13427 RepID=A0ACB9AG83_CICIN|nr:hypothetical protein L2E82_38359 [Cichorium intybus]